ncbi:MAG: hypothetical protein WBC22_09975 [Sedimentisphaerales bacterium]
MIGKIQTNQIRELLDELSSRQLNSGSNAKNSDADVSVQVNYASLIDQAMQVPQADDDVVAAARELLLSGQLESPENIRAAAENIIDFGI